VTGNFFSVTITESERASLPGRAARARVTSKAFRALLDELFREYERPLGKYLVQMVRDRELAEDLLQDVFHDALRNGGALAEADSPAAWLFGIARNKALAALRRRRRFRHVRRRLWSRAPDTSRDDHEFVAVNELLEQTLAPADRALILLRYLYGFSAVELAEMTGRTPAAVRQRLARARDSLLASIDSTPPTRRQR
jgi:RNA polymerase sigma-70 factor, ECF subfamily